jgi:hypothetical protein
MAKGEHSHSACLHPPFATRHSPFAYFNRSINAIAAAGARILPS